MYLKYDPIILEIVVGLYINVTSPYNNLQKLKKMIWVKNQIKTELQKNRKQKTKQK